MHDGKRIGNSSTGKFICSKNKRVVNPLPLVVALVNIATTEMTRFIYGIRIKNITKIFEMIEYPIIKPKVDKNSTCIAAQHSLLESLLCLNKGLHIYQVQNRG